MMNNKYKSLEQLKKELGDKFEEYMYNANIELLNKIDKAIEYCEEIRSRAIDIDDGDFDLGQDFVARSLLNILKGSE